MAETLASLVPAEECRNSRFGLDVGAAAMNGRNCSWERRERDRERERERRQCTWDERDFPGAALSSIPLIPLVR